MKYLLSLIVFYCNIAAAQNLFKGGYIKHLDGHLEYGYIQVIPPDLPSEICYFKSSLNDVAQEYTPAQLQGYAFIPGSIYYSIAFPDKPGMFAQAVYSSKSTLYKSGNRYALESNGSFHELTPDKYKETISVVFGECPYITTRVQTATFNEKMFVYLMRSYEKCVQQKNPATFQGTEFNLKATLLAGIDFTSLSFGPSSSLTELAGHSTSNSTPYRVGFQLQIAYPALSSNLSLAVGVTYRQHKQSTGYTTSGATAAYQFNASYSELQIPIGLQIDMSKRFYLQFGMAVNRVSNFQSSQVLDVRNSFGIYQDESIPANTLTTGSPLYFGFGARFNVHGKHHITLNTQYQSCTMTLKQIDTTLATGTANSVSVNLGFTL